MIQTNVNPGVFDLKTKFENSALVNQIMVGDWEASIIFDEYFREMYQNFRRVAGMIYSEADLQKLNLEKRPAFIYNLFLPIILNLAGNFIDNQSKVEAVPVTPGDIRLCKVFTDVMDYIHYNANNLMWESAISYVNAIIGRVGWVCQDWTYRQDNQGMMEIYADDPFTIKWVGDIKRRNLLDVNLLIKSVWMTPEEIRSTYGWQNEELWDVITEKAKIFIGTDPNRRNKMLSHIERVFGFTMQYASKQGYDAVDYASNNFMLQDRTNYYDSTRGIFKVCEAHQRINKKIWVIYDPVMNKEYNITKAVKADEENINSYDQNLMAYVRSSFTYNGVSDPIISKRPIEEITQTAVCPAMNLVLADVPYEVQNGLFKYTPNFCFDFGNDVMQWKSYVDNLTDPITAFNLDQNTIQTYMMKTIVGETWAEEDALGEHEDAFLQNKIGGFKKVKKGALQRRKIQRQMPSPIPASHAQMSIMKEDLVKKISGVRDNALGGSEGSNESGKLYGARVAQTDRLQILPQQNFLKQLKTIGTNTKDFILKKMKPGRILRIAMDENNPFWLEIHEDFVRKIFYDSATGENTGIEQINGNMMSIKYDISISNAPFGEAAKQQEWQNALMMNQAVSSIHPAYGNAELLVEASPVRNKDKWLSHVRSINQKQTVLMQLMQAQQAKQQQVSDESNKMRLEREGMQLQDQRNDMTIDQILQDQVMNHIKGIAD